MSAINTPERRGGQPVQPHCTRPHTLDNIDRLRSSARSDSRGSQSAPRGCRKAARTEERCCCPHRRTGAADQRKRYCFGTVPPDQLLRWTDQHTAGKPRQARAGIALSPTKKDRWQWSYIGLCVPRASTRGRGKAQNNPGTSLRQRRRYPESIHPLAGEDGAKSCSERSRRR